MERRMSSRRARRTGCVVLVVALLLTSCGPSIIEEVAKDILFARQYNLTVIGDDHCTTVPSGTVVVSHAEAKAISATAEAGYHVAGWTHVGGAAVTFANAATASTTVRLEEGDATIKAWSVPHDWVLTVTSEPGGSTDPAGTVYVLTGEARAIVATPDTGYHFVNWTLVNGSGIYCRSRFGEHDCHADNQRCGGTGQLCHQPVHPHGEPRGHRINGAGRAG